MEGRIRIGVIGAGLIAQVEHIPNLLGLPDRFEVVGVADPSATGRGFVAGHFRVPVYPDSDALLGQPLDAVLIAAPDFAHLPEILKALGRGLHVFCEKPLCYAPADADAIIAARDRVGKVVQVGTMKRYDPAYQACLDLLPGDAARLRYVSVEVNDPDAWPFIAQHPHRFGSDLPAALIEAGRRAQAEQIERAIGADIPAAIKAGFAGRYSSSLVHDVNAVHGMLDRMGVPDGEVIGGEIFANGDGGLGTVRLLGGQAVWQMAHVVVPKLADYRERIALFFEDRIVELTFPAPYLNNQPTRLVVRQSDGMRLETREVRPGFGEAFVRELEAFHDAVVGGAPVMNSVEAARRDQVLLCALARQAASRGVS
jgi:predicted dehydrogenase